MAQKHGEHSACLVDSVSATGESGPNCVHSSCHWPHDHSSHYKAINRTDSLWVSFSLSRNVAVVFVGFSILSVCASDTRSPSRQKGISRYRVPQRFPVCLWRVGVHVAGAPKPCFDSCLVSNRLPLSGLVEPLTRAESFPIEHSLPPIEADDCFFTLPPGGLLFMCLLGALWPFIVVRLSHYGAILCHTSNCPFLPTFPLQRHTID